jgi:L-fuconolactonase
MSPVQRRDFLKASVSLAVLPVVERLAFARTTAMPILDAHIHLFDPTRAEGVPWPEKDDVIYKPTLPERYAPIAEPFGIVGAIAVECSPRKSDNDWVLQIAEKNPVMVGMIGDLLPEDESFPNDLERFHANPLFLGIRYGNLWGRDLGKAVENPTFVEHLKLLAQSGLVMESANPDAALIAAIVRVTDRVPDLRVVVDHLPQADPPESAAEHAKYLADLHELAARPGVFVKGSEVLRRVQGKVPKDLAFYRARLDEIWGIFGEDRMIFGSDWPNSDHLASYGETFGIIHEYVAGKGAAAMEKFFFRNSQAVYRWKPRTAEQGMRS